MIIVYTNCENDSVRLFKNETINKVFNLPINQVIPHVTIENPIVAI